MPVFLLLVQNSFAVFHQIRVLSWGARDFFFPSCFASVMNKTLTACHVSWRHPSACDGIDVAGTFVWPTSYTNRNIPTSFFLNTIVSPNNYLPTQTYSCVKTVPRKQTSVCAAPQKLACLEGSDPADEAARADLPPVSVEATAGDRSNRPRPSGRANNTT